MPKTIHRSQGDTLESLVIDFPRSTREHMHYVGLSRVTSLANLHIVSLNEQKISASKKVEDEMRRLRESARLQLCIPVLYSTQMEHILKIVFANVHSLHLHFNDVINDFNLMASDIMIFVETALSRNDQHDLYDIKDFKQYRNDYNNTAGKRQPYGSVVYMRQSDTLVAEMQVSPNPFDTEITITSLIQPLQLYIEAVYRSRSKVTITRLIEALELFIQ